MAGDVERDPAAPAHRASSGQVPVEEPADRWPGRCSRGGAGPSGRRRAGRSGSRRPRPGPRGGSGGAIVGPPVEPVLGLVADPAVEVGPEPRGARARLDRPPGGDRPGRRRGARRGRSGPSRRSARRPPAAAPASRPRPRTGRAAGARASRGPTPAPGRPRGVARPRVRTSSAQARETASGESTVTTRRPSSCRGLRGVERRHREQQPGHGRRLGVVGQHPAVRELVRVRATPGRSSPFKRAQLLEAGEGRRVDQVGFEEVDRRPVGQLAVEVGERLGRRTPRTSTTARSPASRPPEGRRSARCNTTARTGGSPTSCQAAEPRTSAATAARQATGCPTTSGQGIADRHHAPAGEGGEEEEGRQEQADAVVRRGRQHPEDGQEGQVEGEVPGERVADPPRPGQASQTSPTTDASKIPAGTVIAIRTQALCQGRL